MSESKLLNFFKVLFLLGIFTLLLIRVLKVEEVPIIEFNGDLDPTYVLDLLADSGNSNPHRELDQALFESRKILLTTDINAHTTKLVVASLLLLNEQDSSAPIDLYVRTNGGYYDDAFAVVDAMRMIDAPVNTFAVGGCHSSGAVIVAAGTGTRTALANAIIMIHDNLSEDGKTYSMDTKENARMLLFWQNFKQLPSSWFTEAGDDKHYITAQEALSFGLVDAVQMP